MATEFREFSSDETSSVIPHFEGSLPVAKGKKKDMAETARAPLNTMQLPLNNTPIAPDPNVESVTNAVTKANQQIQQDLPKPQAPSSVKELGKEVQQVGRSIGDTLMENWMIPAGILATYGAYKLLSEKPPTTVHPSEQPQPPSNKSIRDRMLLGEVKEPTLEAPVTEPDVSAKPTTKTVEGPPPPLKDAPLVESGLQNTFQNELNKQVESLQKAGAVPGSAAPNVAPQPVAPAAPATPTVTQAVEAGVSPTKALQVDVAKQLDATPPVQSQFVTGTGREVIPGQGKETKKFKTEYKSPVDVPKGYFFLPEGQYIDVLRNDLGQQTYTQQYKNKPFPTDYEKAVAEAKSINRELNRPTRAEMKASGIEPPEVTPGINKPVSGKKIVKVGGVLGSLVAMSDIASAGQRGGMKEAAQTLGEALLPMGVTPSQLASGTLTPEIIAAQNQFMQERQKLGSPYRSVPPPR